MQSSTARSATELHQKAHFKHDGSTTRGIDRRVVLLQPFWPNETVAAAQVAITLIPHTTHLGVFLPASLSTATEARMPYW